MAVPAPELYKKNTDQVISEIEQDLKDLDIGWEGRQNGPGWALVRFFGRLSELAVNRLNQVPDKHFFAFLNTAGIDFVPPGPAVTELSFTMADDGPSSVLIPKGSQMATVETESIPEIVFETDRDMTLSPNSLTYAFAFDPVNMTDYTRRATAEIDASYPAFVGDQERQRRVYMSDDTLFTFEDDTQREASRITLTVSIETQENPGADNWDLSWSGFDGEAWVDLTSSLVSDGTNRFSQTGDIVFADLPALAESEQGGTAAVWIACSLTGGTGRDHLPRITDIQGKRSILLENKVMTADSLFSAIQSGTTFVPLDQANDFFPLGQKPSRLDTFYLQLDESLNKGGATISLSMDINHAPDDLSGLEDKPALSAVTRWEYFGKEGWTAISELSKQTAMFRNPGNVTLSFSTPEDILSCTVNDAEGYWIRARMISGNFEIDGGMVEITLSDRKVLTWVPPKLYAPIISHLEIQLDVSEAATADKRLSGMMGSVDYRYKDYSGDLAKGKVVSPFLADEEGPACYLGFAKAFPAGKWIQVRIDVDEDVKTAEGDLGLSWEYFNGLEFCPLRISDGTEDLSKQGYLGFFAPEDHVSGTAFGKAAYYIRVIPKHGITSAMSPYLKSIRPNTIPATNSVTLKDVVLGSSDGKGGQQFYVKKTPVLFGVELAVLEPDIPPDEELENHIRELVNVDSSASVFPYSTSGNNDNQRWVRWIQVSDFFSSKDVSRHFNVDAVTGEILFGDGIRGAIPPVGLNNIKVVSYKSHNGALGNVDADTVVVVRNPSGDLEHVKTVTNAEAAAGGSDVESLEEIRLRGPQRLKHRERAVTWEDYEWLAREASSEIRTARCFPVTDVLGQTQAGHVTVVITPESKDKKPSPGPALIRKVTSFLEQHVLGNLKKDGSIHVSGPSYVECMVKATVQPVHPESSDQVELDILKHLDSFLNPLTGGPGNTGWTLGRDVFLSEISAVIENVSGVDHVESLTLSGSLQQYTLYFSQEEGAYRSLPFDVARDSQVETFDERMKFLLADPLVLASEEEPQAIRSLTIYGFKADDSVNLVSEDNTAIKENLTLLSVTDTRIMFQTPFAPPSDWDQCHAVMSGDGRLRLPLDDSDATILDSDGNISGVIVKVFIPGDLVCVVMGTRRDPVLEFLPVDRVSQAESRIYVPEHSLVFSGTHDIDMMIGG